MPRRYNRNKSSKSFIEQYKAPLTVLALFTVASIIVLIIYGVEKDKGDDDIPTPPVSSPVSSPVRRRTNEKSVMDKINQLRINNNNNTMINKETRAMNSAKLNKVNFLKSNMKQLQNRRNVPGNLLKTRTGVKPVTLEGNRQAINNLRNYLEKK